MSHGSILQEEPRTFAEIAHKRKLSIPTVWRWAEKGVSGIRLESYRAGRKRFSSDEAVERFLRAINGGRIERADATSNGADDREARIAAAARYVAS